MITTLNRRTLRKGVALIAGAMAMIRGERATRPASAQGEMLAVMVQSVVKGG